MREDAELTRTIAVRTIILIAVGIHERAKSLHQPLIPISHVHVTVPEAVLSYISARYRAARDREQGNSHAVSLTCDNATSN